MYDKNNIFAKILRKEVYCEPIYEDEKVFVFNDINPQAKIHILVIPKISVINFNDFVNQADKETISHFFSIINKITSQYKIDKSGFRIISNNGLGGGQEVPHFHVHILAGENLSRVK